MSWQMIDCEIRRKGVPIAQCVKIDDKWGWKWIGEATLHRIGFSTKDECLPDVKYFHRYDPPTLTLTFRSGRKISIGVRS